MTEQADPPSANSANSAILFIVLAAFVAFGGCLGASFHLDDYTLFSQSSITSPAGWWQVWRPLQTRPLTYFSFWLNYQLAGQNAIAYHAVNLALHLIAVCLLARILLRLLSQKVALIAAAMFALHPIQSEAVVYVFARASLLMTVFCLLSMRSWLDRRDGAAVAWFALALLSKEECVTFPLFLLLLRWAVWPALGMLSLALAAGLRVLLALKILHISGAGATAGISPIDYFSTQGIVILRYFRLLVIPYGYTFDPYIPVVSDWRAWLAWTGILGATALLWRRGQGKWLAAGLLLLAPSSTIFPAADLAADRRLYLPMVAFAIFGGMVLRNVSGRMLVLPAVALAALSVARTQVWRTERGLWTEAVARAPTKLRPRVLLARASDPNTALMMLDAAQALAPSDPRPAVEKGLRWMELNRPDIALANFEHALILAPHDAGTLNDRGVTLAKLGRRDEAIADFRHALRVDPCLASARANLERLGVREPIRCSR